MIMGSLRVTKTKKIYVRFSFGEKQREEPTIYFCTGKGGTSCRCGNCQSARALLYSVEKDIRENNFDYASYFPKSRAVKDLGIIIKKDITFSQYSDSWLNSSSFEYSTLRSYKNHINKINVHFADISINEIIPTMIKTFKKTLEKYSVRYQKHILTTFSTIMNSAKNDRLIEVNPLIYVPKPKVSAKKADPFFLDEIKIILEYTQKHYPHMTLFFAIGFFMGLREGEIMALKWGDFDFTKNILRVQRTITDGKIKESTKTAEYRDIPIPEILFSYINNHKQYTLLKSERCFLIMSNRPYLHYSSLHDSWTRILKGCNIRYMEIYQMRHSFACNSLSLGFELSYIQMMLGHTSLDMVLKIYGNFIPPNNRKNGFKNSHFWGNTDEPTKHII